MVSGFFQKNHQPWNKHFLFPAPYVQNASFPRYSWFNVDRANHIWLLIGTPFASLTRNYQYLAMLTYFIQASQARKCLMKRYGKNVLSTKPDFFLFCEAFRFFMSWKTGTKSWRCEYLFVNHNFSSYQSTKLRNHQFSSARNKKKNSW